MTPDSAVPGWDVSVPPTPSADAAEGASRRDAPTLSVVITYYRGAQVICDAVESVLAQTVSPHEIVICDDGSPDDLHGVLGALGEHVKVIRKENGGTGSAANAAVRAASGEYVVQLDQDDAFMPRRLEAIAATLRARPDLDIVATDASIEISGERLTTLEAVNPYPETDQRVAMLRTCTFLWPARSPLAPARAGWLRRELRSHRGLGLLPAAPAGRRARRLRPRAALPLASDP